VSTKKRNILRLKISITLQVGGVKTPSSKALGKNVCKLRAVAGITQEQLAEKADISRRYVQLIEAGIYTPTIAVVSRLRSALKVSWDDLLKGC